MENEEASRFLDDLAVALGGATAQQEEENPITASAVAVAALHSAPVASGANAPPGAESDRDTQTKFAISQIPTNIRDPSTFTNTYYEFPFTLDAHKAFLKEFQDLWDLGQLRHDYFSTTRKIAIRMATVLQTAFAWNVGDNITNDLRIRKYHPEKLIADFAVNIKQRINPTVDFVDNGSWHSPDGAFAHIDAYYPGVVFEVSYAAQKLPFQELAQQYILGSEGEVQVVVGFDIEYPAAQKARIMVWRKKEALVGEIEAELVVDEDFRHAGGTMNMGCQGLNLRLGDFCPARMIPDEVKPLIAAPTYLGHDTGIHISARDLCFFLNKAIQHHRLVEQHLALQKEQQEQQGE